MKRRRACYQESLARADEVDCSIAFRSYGAQSQSRSRHPAKDFEALLRSAEKQGWRVKRARATSRLCAQNPASVHSRGQIATSSPLPLQPGEHAHNCQPT